MTGTIIMTRQALERCNVIKRLERREIKQTDAAVLLGLGARQVRNLVARHKEAGDEGLVCQAIGKPSNRQYQLDFKELVLDLVRLKYPDFGPTLAAEYLQERENIKIGTETLRLWLIEHKMHKVKHKRKSRVHHPRERREHYGELIQIDGSYHDWFEGRADKCCVIGAIDDATGKIMQLWPV
jgi:transposase